MGVQKFPAAYLAGGIIGTLAMRVTSGASQKSQAGDVREIPALQRTKCGAPRLHRSFDEFPLSSTGPRIICQAELNSVGNGGMVIEQENIHAVRIGVR